MFEATDLMLNTESVPSNISYKSFKTSYCDHRNFDSGNQALYSQLFLKRSKNAPFLGPTTMDNSSYRLNFDLGKKNKIHHHS